MWSGNGHRYLVVVEPGLVSWFNAVEGATAKGGYLATITSEAENAFVFDLAAHTEGAVIADDGNQIGPWLGGAQLVGSGDAGAPWSWVTGEPFTFTAWAPLQPSNDRHEGGYDDDRLLYVSSARTATWGDALGGQYTSPSYVVEIE